MRELKKQRKKEEALEAETLIREKKFYNDPIIRCEKEFLSDSTAGGLRMTIKSTIELSKVLLETKIVQYVLTRKLNQDCLEVRYYFIKKGTFLQFLN